MNSESFCYWLQGFLEVSGAKSVDAQQLQVIKDHLNLVFQKKTPNYDFNKQLHPNMIPLPSLLDEPIC